MLLILPPLIMAIGAGVLADDVQGVKVRYGVDRDHLFLAKPIDHQVAGDTEQMRFGMER